jgi:lipoprotein signal peptidase
MLLFNGILRFKYLILAILVISLNFFISFLAGYLGFWNVENYFPAGFGFGWIATILIFSVGLFLICKLELLAKYPLITTFLIAGAVSNFLEYTIFGFVVDYINLGFAVLNLADVEIYGGLVLLNWKVFFGNK